MVKKKKEIETLERKISKIQTQVIFLILGVLSLFSLVLILNHEEPQYVYKTLKLNNTNEMIKNVKDYSCWGTVESKYYSYLDELYVSTWERDSTGKGARYGECIVKIEVKE